MINLKDANGDDRPTNTYLEQMNDTVIRGYRHSTGWSKKQQIYFTAVFSQPIHLALYHDSVQVAGNHLQGLDVKGNVSIVSTKEELCVKVGISPVSMDNAMGNIQQEIKNWDFEKIVEETTKKWNTELSKLQVETNNVAAKRVFYTCLLYTSPSPRDTR